jgi:hypothetical protein
MSGEQKVSGSRRRTRAEVQQRVAEFESRELCTECKHSADVAQKTTERQALDSRRPTNSESAFPQSKSCTVVSTVTRVAATTPTMWVVRFPAVSYASSVNLPR